MTSPAAAPSEGTPPADGRGSGVPVLWLVLFLGVFVGLVVSSVLLLNRDHLPVRFIDVDATWLAARENGGTRLHIVLREAPYRGQLVHQIREPSEGQADWTVVIRLSAQGLDAEIEGEGGPEQGSRRTIEIDLPDIPRVRILDMRFGRPESWMVERRSGDPRSS
jgi:hypothetical protein